MKDPSKQLFVLLVCCFSFLTFLFLLLLIMDLITFNEFSAITFVVNFIIDPVIYIKFSDVNINDRLLNIMTVVGIVLVIGGLIWYCLVNDEQSSTVNAPKPYILGYHDNIKFDEINSQLKINNSSFEGVKVSYTGIVYDDVIDVNDSTRIIVAVDKNPANLIYVICAEPVISKEVYENITIYGIVSGTRLFGKYPGKYYPKIIAFYAE